MLCFHKIILHKIYKTLYLLNSLWSLLFRGSKEVVTLAEPVGVEIQNKLIKLTFSRYLGTLLSRSFIATLISTAFHGEN